LANFQPQYIDCVILCGGNILVKQGNKEKLQCMVNIERRPFLSYIIDQLSAFSFDKVIFAVDENSRDLRTFFEDRYAFINFKYSYEDIPLGTIGAAKKAIIEFGENEDVLIIKGNTYTNFDIFDMRNYYDCFQNNKKICSLSYDSIDKFTFTNKENIDLNFDKYPAGLYLIKRKDLLSLPDICTFKEIEIKDHFYLRMDKHKTLDINLTKNNHKNIKLFFRKVWGYDWSRYDYFDDGVKKCLYCNNSSRIKLSKGKYHGWKMRCGLKNIIVERMSQCEEFELRGDKPYFHIKPDEGKI
jgi:D-glycero-alpha-D-manno-heptose 1-phosphate guanylyltransferase